METIPADPSYADNFLDYTELGPASFGTLYVVRDRENASSTQLASYCRQVEAIRQLSGHKNIIRLVHSWKLCCSDSGSFEVALEKSRKNRLLKVNFFVDFFTKMWSPATPQNNRARPAVVKREVHRVRIQQNVGSPLNPGPARVIMTRPALVQREAGRSREPVNVDRVLVRHEVHTTRERVDLSGSSDVAALMNKARQAMEKHEVRRSPALMDIGSLDLGPVRARGSPALVDREVHRNQGRQNFDGSFDFANVRGAAVRNATRSTFQKRERDLPLDFGSSLERSDRRQSSYNSRYLDSFDQLRLLGKGGFGLVFEAKNKLDSTRYAVKRIKLDGQDKAKLLREVQAMASLTHTNVVRYYASWVESPPAGFSYPGDSANRQAFATAPARFGIGANRSSEWLFIQMELMKSSLRDLLSKSTPAVQRAVQMFKDIVAGVAYLHQKGYIHRDLKPDNIFIGFDGTAKVGDLGLTVHGVHHAVGVSPTSGSPLHTAQLGTPLYASPEQFHPSGQYGKEVDIYSLGLILFELFHPAKTQLSLRNHIMGIRNGKLPDNFPTSNPQLVRLLRQMLDSDPKKRPSAEQILRQIRIS